MNVGGGTIYFLKKKIKFALPCLSVGLFLAIIAYGFPDSPSPWFDEGINLGIAKSWVKHGVYSMQIGPNEFVEERSLLITTNYPVLAFIALAFKLFGIGLAPAKIVMFVFLAVFLALAFQFAKKHYGYKAAVVSVALLVTFLPLYGNGKSVLGEVPGLVYFLGGLLLIDKKKAWHIFFSGLLFGLAAATKSVYLLILASLGLAELIFAIKHIQCPWRTWLILALGLALPLLIWIYTLLPLEVTMDFFGKMFALYSNPYRVEHTVGQNIIRFFTETTPAHFLLLFGIFIAAKVVGRFRSITKAELILVIFIVFNLIFYVRTVGWYRYFFPAHVLILLLFPGAVFSLVERATLSSRWRSGVVGVAFGALVAIQLVTLRYRLPDPLYYNPEPRQFAEKVTQLVPADKELLIVDNPALAFLIDHDKQRQYVKTSPHIAVGRDVLAKGEYSAYIVSEGWEGNYYLGAYLPARQKYDLIWQDEKFNLYALRR